MPSRLWASLFSCHRESPVGLRSQYNQGHLATRLVRVLFTPLGARTWRLTSLVLERWSPSSVISSGFIIFVKVVPIGHAPGLLKMTLFARRLLPV